jgi:hypothetical protein
MGRDHPCSHRRLLQHYLTAGRRLFVLLRQEGEPGHQPHLPALSRRKITVRPRLLGRFRFREHGTNLRPIKSIDARIGITLLQRQGQAEHRRNSFG